MDKVNRVVEDDVHESWAEATSAEREKVWRKILRDVHDHPLCFLVVGSTYESSGKGKSDG